MDNSRPGPGHIAGSDDALDARAELALVSSRLQAARKALRRDWEALAPRERSEQSRLVRDLELQSQALLDEIDAEPPPGGAV